MIFENASYNVDDGVVEGNLLHHFAESGVNLYPNTTGGLYKGNVVVRSEVNFAVNGTTGNTIRNNVISNPFGPSNVNLSNGATATIRDNCAWPESTTQESTLLPPVVLLPSHQMLFRRCSVTRHRGWRTRVDLS